MSGVVSHRLMSSSSMLLGAVGGMLLAVLGITGLDEWKPVAFETVNQVSVGRVSPERFEVLLELKNLDQCPAMTERYLWRDLTDVDGESIREFMPVGANLPPFANASPRNRFIVSLERPSGLPGGQWHYQSRTTSRCSLLSGLIGPQVRFSPDLLLDLGDGAERS